MLSPLFLPFIYDFKQTKTIPEVIQFLSCERVSDSKKERLTKDVRYQEFNEVTLDLFRVTPESVKGHFIAFLGYFAVVRWCFIMELTAGIDSATI